MNTTPRDTPHSGTVQVFRPWQPAFLSALRAGGSPVRACEAARIDRRWVYRVRAFDAGFREAWDDAVAGHGDDLQAEAVRRAVHGVHELVLHRGKPVIVWLLADGTAVPPHTDGATGVPLTRVRKSDALLIKLLAAARPAEFGTPRQRELAANAAAAAAPAGPPFDVFARIRELTGTDFNPAPATSAEWAEQVRRMTDDELDARIASLRADQDRESVAEVAAGTPSA